MILHLTPISYLIDILAHSSYYSITSFYSSSVMLHCTTCQMCQHWFVPKLADCKPYCLADRHQVCGDISSTLWHLYVTVLCSSVPQNNTYFEMFKWPHIFPYLMVQKIKKKNLVPKKLFLTPPKPIRKSEQLWKNDI